MTEQEIETIARKTDPQAWSAWDAACAELAAAGDLAMAGLSSAQQVAFPGITESLQNARQILEQQALRREKDRKLAAIRSKRAGAV